MEFHAREGENMSVGVNGGEFVSDNVNEGASMSADVREVPLFKVVFPDGAASFKHGFLWSLPAVEGDVVTPGAWHEHDGELRVGFSGFHLTPCPSRYFDKSGLVCFLAEAEGVLGDPTCEHQVVARRVRLVRRVSFDDAHIVSEAWFGRELKSRAVAQAKARAKVRGERLQDAAKIARASTAADVDAGVESPALFAFRVLAALDSGESWRHTNSLRRSALEHAVRFLKFHPDDITTIHRSFDGSYWLEGERLYATAIEAKNASACVALEKLLNRKPWWGMTIGGEKTRLSIGAQVHVGDRWVRVTSFREDYINAVEEDGGKVVKIRREDLGMKPTKSRVPSAAGRATKGEGR